MLLKLFVLNTGQYFEMCVLKYIFADPGGRDV
jgi:hypothetical protein